MTYIIYIYRKRGIAECCIILCIYICKCIHENRILSVTIVICSMPKRSQKPRAQHANDGDNFRGEPSIGKTLAAFTATMPEQQRQFLEPLNLPRLRLPQLNSTSGTSTGTELHHAQVQSLALTVGVLLPLKLKEKSGNMNLRTCSIYSIPVKLKPTLSNPMPIL